MSDHEPRGLTPREIECLKLTSIMSSKEIARRLGISAATVDVHIAKAARKLGASDRRRALRKLMYREAGLEPPGPINPPKDSPSTGLSRIPHEPPDPDIGADDARGPPHLPAEQTESGQSPRRKHGMGRILVRFLMDVVLVTVFFFVFTGAAVAVHMLVVQCEHAEVDRIVILMLKGIHYILVAIDGIGVLASAGLLTFRFIKALRDADD